jgi:hypothetical protein
MTMSDTSGRPLLGTLQNMPGFSFMGVPVNIVSHIRCQMSPPDATPVAYGNCGRKLISW